MTTARPAGPSQGYVLAHPVYLDEAMMTSFLAHLEGGVARGDSVTSSAKGAVERSRQLGASFRVNLGLADVDASGQRGTQNANEDSTQISFERNHTSASLFNILYEYLLADGLLIPVHEPEELHTVQSGHIVEIVGRYKGNSFEDTIDAAAAFIPYIQELREGQIAPDPTPSVAQRSRSSNPGRRREENRQASHPQGNGDSIARENEDAGMRLAARLVEDAGSRPVKDLVVETAQGLSVVLTVTSEFYGPRVKELLRDGEFRVVGKVTRVLGPSDQIRLSRRSVLGSLGGDTAQQIISGVVTAGIAGGDVADSIVGPCLQVLPMAIFV